jgi:hypothetical protein
MSRILTAFFLASLCGSLLQAQEPANQAAQPATPTTSAAQPVQSSSTQASTPARIASGSVIPVELAKSVDAKKAKAGDEVVTKVTVDLRNDAGTVLVPKDTKVLGHVTEAQARTKEQKESQLAIVFDKAVLKNGETMQMPMSIQAIIAPPNQNNSANSQPSSGYPAGTGGGSPSPGMSGGSPQGNSSQGASSQQTMGGTAQLPSAPQASDNVSSGSRPPISGDTKGVIGITNLSLAAASDPTQGSMMSSEKNNVKLEGGTFLLLRVNH